MNMNSTARRRNRTTGFTLVETLVALLVLTILMVGVFSAINKAQGYYRVESQKVDLTQQQREFIDQFTRDLHQAGYPTPASQGLPTPPGGFSGLTALTPTDLVMQGDLDGSGVQQVEYVYNPPNAPNCGCVQRIVNGVTANATNTMENILNGTTQIFTAYDASGGPLSFPIATTASIRGVSVTVTVQGNREADNRTPMQVTMTGMARLPNND
jgi:prepilin-type N-terminal cleavage/methylation domain-containing protein